MRIKELDALVVGLLVAAVGVAGYAWMRPEDTQRAVDLVAPHLVDNPIGVTAGDLVETDNPIGAGRVVHIGPRPTGALPQKPVWILWQDTAYALNGPAKTLTPGLPWGWPRPSAGEEAHWRGSGLVARSTGELVRHLYVP